MACKSLSSLSSGLDESIYIQDKDWDARFSRENKAWAQTVPMPEDSEDGNRRSHWLVDSYPGLVNLFVDQVRDLAREREKEKPPVIQKLRQEPAAQCPRARTDCVQNPGKTDNGELVTAYECDPMTADQEFLLSKHRNAVNDLTGTTVRHTAAAVPAFLLDRISGHHLHTF